MESQPDVWPGPVGRPARPHWWSVQEPPPAARSRPISARRAYAEVLLVFAAFFAASIVAGGETLARRYPPPSGSWAVFTPAILSELGTCVLAVLVTVLLSARRGITAEWLGFSWPRRRDGRPGAAQSLRIGVWAISALLVGGAVTGALSMGHKLSQPGHQDTSYVIFTVVASLTAGIVEETVVLAFVVTTLRQARRPLPEIVLVAVLLRCSYHDYYGLGVVGIALWAAVFVWLFLRAGSVLPLIVVHVLWDTAIFLGQRWHAVEIASGYAWLLLLLAAGISWLLEVHSRRAGPPGTRRPGMGVGGRVQRVLRTLDREREPGSEQGGDGGDHSQPARSRASVRQHCRANRQYGEAQSGREQRQLRPQHGRAGVRLGQVQREQEADHGHAEHDSVPRAGRMQRLQAQHRDRRALRPGDRSDAGPQTSAEAGARAGPESAGARRGRIGQQPGDGERTAQRRDDQDGPAAGPGPAGRQRRPQPRPRDQRDHGECRPCPRVGPHARFTRTRLVYGDSVSSKLDRPFHQTT